MRGMGKTLRFWAFAFLLGACFAQVGTAAPDFKIRYNPKFPCLEVMDSKAVKITDISEGTQGEVVTSGKASIKLSFLKNSSGQPEVTLTEAKSALSEMELEAFGLSVGMKPAGVVTVRFGSDNKPQFEMDRTGGARFLMADLGNLDTAAGKESVAAMPAQPSKGLVRFQERLASWKSSGGKGGWSNRPGKVLACGKQTMVTYTGLPARKLLDGEAIQIGAEVAVEANAPLLFQSGPGVFHMALPGTRFMVAPLEAGQKDVKVTLIEGTLLTEVLSPLTAPRLHVQGVGTGVVLQSSDGLFQVSKSGAAGSADILVAAGTARLVEEAGAAVVAQLSPGKALAWPGDRSPRSVAMDTPEMRSLQNLKSQAREALLTDMVEDAIKAASADAEEILRSACTADPALARVVAQEAVEIRPDLHGLIVATSGVADLPAPFNFQSETQSFQKRAEPWLRGEPSLTSLTGKVFQVDGRVTYADGLPVTRSMVLKSGEIIKTGGDGRLLFLAAPGTVAEIPPGSEVRLVEMKGRFQDGQIVESKAILDARQGRAFCSIVSGYGAKIQAEVRTPKGVARSQSSDKKDNNQPKAATL